MGGRLVEGQPRIALALPSGEVRDLSADEANRVVQAYSEVRREWIRWRRMTQKAGRLILIDPTVVERILAETDDL